MKILMVTEFFPTGKDLTFTGGVEARTFYVAKHLATKHEITVLTTRLIDSQESERLFNFKVIRVGKPQPYHATSSSILNRITFVKNSIKASNDIEVDVVEGTNFITHLAALLISIKKKIPRVAWYPDVWIGSWIKNAGAIGLLGEILERINLKIGFSSYIAISQQTKHKLEKYTVSKIDVIPCGVDIDEFKSSRSKKENTIICISRLAKYKNIDDLILAFDLLRKRQKGLGLIIVGTGPQEKELKDLATKLKIQNIKFLSNLKRNDLTNLLFKSRIFCLPSQTEGFGIVVIEAAAAGVPYVVSDIPVFKQVTKNGQGGLFFQLANVKDLSLKIEKLLEDQALYQRKIKEGVSLAKNYQWSDIAQATEKVYLNLARNK